MMKILLVLILMFPLSQIEAKGGLQRLATHSKVQKVFGKMVALPLLCLSLISCSVPKPSPQHSHEIAAQSPAAGEPAPSLEYAPTEDFQPRQPDNRISVQYPNGFGGVEYYDAETYMLAKDRLPAIFYHDVLIRYRRGDDNLVGVGKVSSKDSNTVSVIDIETGKVRETIEPDSIAGIFVSAHEGYGDYLVKFSAMHLQKLEGKDFAELGWRTVYGKTKIIFTDGYHVVRVYGIKHSPGKIIKLKAKDRFWALVHGDYLAKLN